VSGGTIEKGLTMTDEPVEADGIAAAEDGADQRSLMELAERFGRDSSVLVLREAELAGARHETDVRRAGRDATAAAIAAVALGTAFLLANWAAVRGLSGSLSGWRAPLLLAAVWLVVGVAVAALPLSRFRHLLSRPSPSIEEREQARDDAAERLRESLEQLAGGLADEAQARMVSAMMPSADGILETGEDVLQASEQLLDDVVESAPGGSVVGQVIDFALIPGRYGVRVATTVLKGGTPEEE
jgi:Putative Actinobacterial Holin-X, holin superfamily III